MARIQKKRKAKKVTHTQNQYLSAELLDKQLISLRTTTFVISSSFWLLSILLKITFTYITFKDIPDYFRWSELLFLLGAAVIPATLGVFSIKVGLRKIRNLPPRIAQRRMKVIIRVYALSIVLYAIAMLYIFGAIRYLADFIYLKAPVIGSSVSNAISTVIGWVLSGIIGNFVYDYLKRKYIEKPK